MRWPRLRRRHVHRIVTGYQFGFHPIYGPADLVIYRGCACGLDLLNPTPKENT